ncbi:type I restriction endonuclease subunit R, EcoR124 family [Corynebacterium pseudodiphtheriticum]|uniref:type I restriction endonuclease subunit R, EcoR124 family n=1 Tax=Corynebacterium pseudodiphtheriticum TaxID=37637 RepID=UPI00321FD2D1
MIDIKELIAEIESIVMRQSQLRDAIDEIVKDLVEEFVDSVTVTTAVDEAWPAYVRRKMAEELNRIIEGEKLKADATWDVVPAAFGSGAAYLGGAKIAKLLPPMSRFSRGGEDRKEKQSRVEQKLHELLARFDPLFVEDGSAELMRMRGA